MTQGPGNTKAPSNSDQVSLRAFSRPSRYAKRTSAVPITELQIFIVPPPLSWEASAERTGSPGKLPQAFFQNGAKS